MRAQNILAQVDGLYCTAACGYQGVKSYDVAIETGLNRQCGVEKTTARCSKVKASLTQ